MSASRRSFLQQTILTGGLMGLLESSSTRSALAEELAAAAQAGVGVGDGGHTAPHDSQNFWDAFGAVADTPSTNSPAGVGKRGLFRKTDPAAATNPSGASDRLVDYYHYYTDPKTKESTLRLATSIDSGELLDHPGDISANVAVEGFHMAGEDRDKFNQLQSAQLRLDMVQNQSLLPEYLDTMAWMSLAGLFPDSTGKLPPLQDLSFNPSSGSQKMSAMVLPGGSGQMAVNLSMTHKASTFYLVIKNLTNEVGRFAPLIGLPAISVTALKGFCNLYGAMEQRTTFLLNSMPKAGLRDATGTAAGADLQRPEPGAGRLRSGAECVFLGADAVPGQARPASGIPGSEGLIGDDLGVRPGGGGQAGHHVSDGEHRTEAYDHIVGWRGVLAAGNAEHVAECATLADGSDQEYDRDQEQQVAEARSV